MHYLLYGTGMQTWEYSPLYAIRSYAYLWLHALPACLHAHVLQTNKVLFINNCCKPLSQFLFLLFVQSNKNKKEETAFIVLVFAGIGVLLRTMCPGVCLLCLRALFLQVSSLSEGFSLCVFGEFADAQLIMFVTQGSLQKVRVARGPFDVGIPRPEHRNVLLVCWLVTFNS